MRMVMLALALQTAQAPTNADTTPAVLRHANGRVPPTVTATLAERAPRLDGRLDDAVWQTTMVAADFTQVLPEDGTQPTERSDVRVVYGEDALYVGARLYDSEPEGIVGRLGRRDTHTSSDQFTVSIDSYHDHRTAFRVSVNPAGIRGDEVTANDDEHGDDSWDPVWEVATRIDSLGWVAEMRIPFSQLRFSTAREQTWGINFTRLIFRKNEWVVWSWVPNTELGFASHFGHLLGLRDVPAPRRLEVLPYTVAKSDFIEGADSDDPFNDGSVQDLSGGLDLKYGVTSDLTLDATINPDFGQVEADPAVVNLSAFETFFRERRPFFVEGANIFRFGAGSGGFVFGAPQLFYSRRVGRAPSRWASEEGGYADNPIATSILGAAKISGQTGGWSIGVLDALTGREYARVQRADGSRASEPVEPLANYGVVSLRKDFRAGATGIGMLATTVHRDLNDPVFEFLRSSAYSGGLDFFHRFARNQFSVNGTISGSHIRGDPAAITGAQRSSARYYQRPDQDYVSLDTTATSMTGYAFSLQAGKVAGNWLYATDFYAYSPGLEVNDAGFETRVDRIFHGIRLERRWLDPGRVFRRFWVSATFAQSWNFGGTNQWRSPYFGFGGQFLNYWNFNVGASYNIGGRSDKATRGGPLMANPDSWNINGFVSTDFRKPVYFGTFGYYSRNIYDGWGGGFGSELVIRPTGAVNLSIFPSFDKTHSIGFYVTQQEDATAAATFGRRYLFSELVQTSLDVTVRVDVALTPNLSIQLWAQPFVAAGDYQRFKELAQPGTFDFLHYGVDNGSTLALDDSTNIYTADPDGAGPAPPLEFANPDFRFRSLRSNLVIRWEYVPGSTLFLVWNHSRSGAADDPTFRALDELGNLFGDDMQNTFIVKLNYWLSL
ncbi:MAG: hypothetical protein GTN62_14245 [Gemmatimonadales bacterium]|nr:hypothetical protein [Gemmatimonadales bacterium]NIN13232.1 hypothetical protein [Gemmatimonadales bacterium]NIN51249.1 hypothetical protein [Gemmatimonadales bacterium]NIP08713.1 hypothetical protein [Gemmatimonadales bacterium]NIR00966.1 hypothetical protein [Gemmatimonadales bacterium]